MKLLLEHEELFSDFCRQMLETRDYDPNYFIVKGVVKARRYKEIATYRYCITFNGFYNFGSADRFFNDNTLDAAKMTYGISRRGFRGNDKVRNFIEAGLALQNYVLSDRHKGYEGWSAIYNCLLENIPGCGPWSAYYLTDMMKVILDRPITAPNFGHLSSSPNMTGPVAGLQFITGIPMKDLLGNEALQMKIFEKTCETIPWTGMEEMESCLCNYLSLHKKRYYVGRDIDRQLPMLKGLSGIFWSARTDFFPEEILGEKNGWDGIRKELMGSHEKGKIWKKRSQ